MSLLAAGASLLGGIFGRKSEKSAINRQNEYNDPVNVRARAERAGFNPLLFIGPGVGQQTTTGGTNYMGSAIADAGMILADGMAKKKESALVSALQKQNKAQADKIIALTLRPKVGGIYERRLAVPTTRQALGLPDVETSVPNLADRVGDVSPSADPTLRPLLNKSPADTRREVDNSSVKTTSGFMVVDQPKLPFDLYAPTLDGDEALQWYDLPSLIPAAGIGAGVKLREMQDARKGAGPRMQIGGRTWQMQKSKPKRSYITPREPRNNFFP